MPRHAQRPLAVAAWILLGLLAAHDVTHLVDDGLRTGAGELALVAVPQWIALAVVMAVILRADSVRSATAALLLGAAAALGFALVHFLPFAPAAYRDLDPSTVSWVLAVVPPVVALVLVALAVRQLAGRRSVAGP